MVSVDVKHHVYLLGGLSVRTTPVEACHSIGPAQCASGLRKALSGKKTKVGKKTMAAGELTLLLLSLNIEVIFSPSLSTSHQLLCFFRLRLLWARPHGACSFSHGLVPFFSVFGFLLLLLVLLLLLLLLVGKA